MAVVVPQEFREEVLGVDKSVLVSMKHQAWSAYGEEKPFREVESEIVGLGFTPSFAAWYYSQVRLKGELVNLFVPAVSSYEAQLADYENWQADQLIRVSKIRRRILAYLLCVLVCGALSLTPGAAYFGGIGALIFFYLMVSDLCKLQGRSSFFDWDDGWTGFIMLPLAFFIPDLGDRKPPQPPRSSLDGEST